jgi:hypothetical protein
MRCFKPTTVSAPLLVLHGANGDEVPATMILTFATKFSTLKNPYEVVVYAGDLHEVAANRRETRLEESLPGSDATFVRSRLTPKDGFYPCRQRRVYLPWCCFLILGIESFH